MYTREQLKSAYEAGAGVTLYNKLEPDDDFPESSYNDVLFEKWFEQNIE